MIINEGGKNVMGRPSRRDILLQWLDCEILWNESINIARIRRIQESNSNVVLPDQLKFQRHGLLLESDGNNMEE